MIWAQQGHLGSFWVKANAIFRLSVALKRPTCHSVRFGAAARSVTAGKLRRLDQPGGFG